MKNNIEFCYNNNILVLLLIYDEEKKEFFLNSRAASCNMHHITMIVVFFLHPCFRTLQKKKQTTRTKLPIKRDTKKATDISEKQYKMETRNFTKQANMNELCKVKAEKQTLNT